MSSNQVIDVRGLRKSYRSGKKDKKVAVDGIDLQINEGEIFALLGPNGAGKTTIIEILEGFRQRDSGDVKVLGEDPGLKHRENRKLRDRIGIVLQSNSDAADFTVHETIHHFAKYYSNPKNVDFVIDSVGLREKADEKIRTLSGGQRRRLDVGLGIIGNPDLLFLDEPTTGFDPAARRTFWDLIRTLKAEGRTIMLTTHYLDEAEALADRVGVIRDGRIIEISTPKDLGGRSQAKAKITWLADGVLRSVDSDYPTAEVAKLMEKYNGEIPGLSVTRPSLEDIYLRMIGELG